MSSNFLQYKVDIFIHKNFTLPKTYPIKIYSFKHHIVGLPQWKRILIQNYKYR